MRRESLNQCNDCKESNRDNYRNNENHNNDANSITTRGRVEVQQSAISHNSSIDIMKSLIRSMDVCFNNFFFGLPDEDDDDDVHRNRRERKSHLPWSEECEKEKLRIAKFKLLQLPHSFEDKNNASTSQIICENASSSYSNIVHSQQESNWDCGVTCILMFIRYLKALETGANSKLSRDKTDAIQNSTTLDHIERLQKQWMLEKLKTQSIWTIDLVMLLESILNDEAPSRLKFPKRQLQNGSIINYLYCSNNLGVDKTYEDFNYYKNAFGDDERRVTKLFKEANEKGIPMLNISSVDIEFVTDLVAREICMAVVLIDYNVLFRGKCHNIQCDSGDVSTNFSGHYIILAGISKDECHLAEARKLSNPISEMTYCIVIIDPGSSDHCTYCFNDIFESSWRSRGTDR